jgi:putative membrane protein
MILVVSNYVKGNKTKIMKSINFFKTLTAVALFAMTFACGTKKEDSADVAQDANEETAKNRDEEKDADFVVKTVASNYAEVKLAQLAQNRSKNTKIKDLAKMLEKDHTKVISDLKSFASKNGIVLPTEETNDDMDEINDLAAESDATKFDKKWCDELEDRHEESIDNFEKRLSKSEDLELQNWINATLPSLRNHLAMLKENKEQNDNNKSGSR